MARQLVRDDYAGWYQVDDALAGVQQCSAHLIRHLQGVLDLDPQVQLWAGQVQNPLRDATTFVRAAMAAGRPIDAEKLANARWRYDQGVLVGISINLSLPWHKGNRPGLVLARRLKDEVDQVWLLHHEENRPPDHRAAGRPLHADVEGEPADGPAGRAQAAGRHRHRVHRQHGRHRRPGTRAY
ncbi:hypothetical protein [Dactylosporangium sp. NPDC048998]|uniref:hypothetical protein n=1 Tax=Dactylosporangium sp. NPDC048998 TaxID=3363976 RepID=UPI00371B80B5